MVDGIPGPLKIGFVSTRFAGTDGVSLETAKWAEVLEDMGHTCSYFAGLSDRLAAQSMVVEEAFYRHPEMLARHREMHHSSTRSRELTEWIHHWRDFLRRALYQYLQDFAPDLLIVENALSIPVHVPLGLAITEVIAETGIPTVAHHHDFAWERKRFLVNCIQDYLAMAFPPDLPSISHVVINSHAQHQLARRRGVGAALIPNVMHFERPTPGIDSYSADLREHLGLEPDELFVLQPTRIIQRKGIEHAVELVHRLGRKARLVISHASGDEGTEYERRVIEYARLLGVKVILGAEHFDDERGVGPGGEKIYSIWDAYPHADLVTYPSVFEGFGNAFLEAVYYRKPVVVNNYSIYATDIQPKGFQVIELDDYITEATVERAREVLDDPELAARMAAANYELARQHYSYSFLRRKLEVRLSELFGG